MFIGKKVSFRNSEGKITFGVIFDKVIIPLASGNNEYVPMHNYMIVETEKDSGQDNLFFTLDGHKTVHVVNPINIIHVFFEVEIINGGIEGKRDNDLNKDKI